MKTTDKSPVSRLAISRLATALIISFAILVSPWHAQAATQGESAELPEPLARELALPVVEDILRSYSPWHSAEFSGKLHQERLPLSPTVKVYMVRDSLIQISLRAPLVGEVGRVELTQEQILLVNKMKKRYARESAAGLRDLYPGALADLQSLLLARVVLLGEGELSLGNYESFDILAGKNGDYVLTPTQDKDTPESALMYAYLINAASRTEVLMAAVTGKFNLTIEYGYRDRGLQMACDLDLPGKSSLKAGLDFNSVKWGGSQMQPVKTDSYTKVGLKEFFGSL